MKMRLFKRIYFFLVLFLVLGPSNVMAQSVTSANDGTGTTISSPANNPNQHDISGGTQAGGNLFHSFGQFGVDQGKTVNFLSNPSIDSILGRVTGGNASIINGLLQVTGGNSNLFLINPAGVIFGAGAQLNVPADFTATTANGIQINNHWFSALGENNYDALSGTPQGFAFTTDNPGSILNAGNLSVAAGHGIQLLGGNVVNTGTLSTPGGNLTIQAVPESGLVTINQEGNLLSLGLPVETKAAVNAGAEPLTALALPQLLTSNNLGHATGVTVENGSIRLSQPGTIIPTDAGVAVAAGMLDVANPNGAGGQIDVLGEQVALVSANLEASGSMGGGSVRVGGDYQGTGYVPNAERVYISRDSVITADALFNGQGGQIIIWADGNTEFYGEASTQGGTVSGDGGLIEVSGQQNLFFDGEANTTADNGEPGTLLLDPTNILISSDLSSSRLGTEIPTDSSDPISILEGELPGDITINAMRLSRQQGNIRLEASNNIVLTESLDFFNNTDTASREASVNGSIVFVADADNDAMGSFLMDRSLSINAPGRAIAIVGANIEAGKLNTSNIDPSTRNTFVDTNDIGKAEDGFIALVSTQGNVVVNTVTSGAGGESSDLLENNNFPPSVSVESLDGRGIYIQAVRAFRALGSFKTTAEIPDQNNAQLTNISPSLRTELVKFFLEEYDEDISNNTLDEFRVIDIPKDYPISILAVPSNDDPEGDDAEGNADRFPSIRIIHGGSNIPNNSSLINITGTGNSNVEDFVIGPIFDDNNLSLESINGETENIAVIANLRDNPADPEEVPEAEAKDIFVLRRQFLLLDRQTNMLEKGTPIAITTPSDELLESLDLDLSIVVGGIVVAREAENDDPGDQSQSAIPRVPRTTMGDEKKGDRMTDDPEGSPQDFENESQETLLASRISQCLEKEDTSSEAGEGSAEDSDCIASQTEEAEHATEIHTDENGVTRLTQVDSE